MFTMGPPFRAVPGATTGLALPYTMNFNGFASYAAMKAFYATLGITISASVPDREVEPTFDYDRGMYYATLYGSDLGGELFVPSNAFNLETKTPYLFGNFFYPPEAPQPAACTIALPVGTLAKQITYDYWKIAGDELMFVDCVYSDGAGTFTQSYPGSRAGMRFARNASPFPGTPPSGSAYITQIVVRSIGSADGFGWALDNLQFLA